MAIWEKLFSKIIFKDYPDTSTPLNASNMNTLSDAIDGIDNRVVELNSNLEIYNKKYLVGFSPVTDAILDLQIYKTLIRLLLLLKMEFWEYLGVQKQTEHIFK